MDRRLLLAGAAIAAIGAATYFKMSGSRDGQRDRGGESRSTFGCGRPAGGDDATAARRATRTPDKTVKDAELRAATRERLRERLGASYPTPKPKARSRPAAPVPVAPPEPQGPSTGPRIEPKYIQERVREDFFPLARQCYEEALSRKPNIQGKVLLKFTIVGDEKIGGIVEDANIGEESTLRDEEFDTCISESMMSMTFPPPKGGGTVTVTYPIDFSPGDDEGDAGPSPQGDGGTAKAASDAGRER